jgi:serine/threonine protein kinase
MKEMCHDNIVKLHSVGRGPLDLADGTTPQEVLFIVMEFAQEGELFEWISNTGRFSEPTARYFMQ